RDVRKPQEDKPRDTIIEDDYVQMLMDAVGYRRGVKTTTQLQVVMAVLDFALETAMRSGEILCLDAQRIHIDQRYVQLWASDTKNGEARQVPLSDGAIEILKTQDAEQPFPIDDKTRDTLFRRVRDRLGLKDAFDFHDSRATAITRLAKKL